MRGRFLIAFLGFALAISPSSFTWAEAPEDVAYVTDRIPKILEFEQTGTKIPWRNPETGNGGIIMVERTYFTDPNTPCRDFILTVDAGEAAPLTAQGTGCRTGQGKWQLSDELELSSLSAMKPTAFLINIARGGVVDEAALIGALRSGEIAGAGLDVFSEEPLPAESPLWEMENVVITPHIGGMSDNYIEQVLPIFEENLRHYMNGDRRSMINIVER